MLARTDILLDFNNMMAEEVGPQGIRKSEIDSIATEMGQVHDGLADLRRLGQLPFQDLPYHEEMAEQVMNRAREAQERFETILLLGIGGSSLGAKLLVHSLVSRGNCRLIVCDHLDSEEWRKISESLDWKKTLLIVVSKSGRTTETLAAFLFFRNCLQGALGEKYKQNLAVITDPKKGPLRKFANDEKILSFDIPPGVGGRYSALTPAGLFPAACCGVDIQGLLSGAQKMDARCKNKDPWFNPALMSAVLHYLLDQKRGHRMRIVMPYGLRLRTYAAWFSQLWAESLGKRRMLKGREVLTGTTPVCASGPEDQHSQLQLFLDGPCDKSVTFLGVPHDSVPLLIPNEGPDISETKLLRKKSVHELLEIERVATEKALRDAGRPNQTILLGDIHASTIGELLYFAEMETVFAGQLYNINPFDQPAVESIKKNIKDYLISGLPSGGQGLPGRKN